MSRTTTAIWVIFMGVGGAMIWGVSAILFLLSWRAGSPGRIAGLPGQQPGAVGEGIYVVSTREGVDLERVPALHPDYLVQAADSRQQLTPSPGTTPEADHVPGPPGAPAHMAGIRSARVFITPGQAARAARAAAAGPAQARLRPGSGPAQARLRPGSGPAQALGRRP